MSDSDNSAGERSPRESATWRIKTGMAAMLKGGVIMDVTTADQARLAEDAGAVAVLSLIHI